ncbi:YgaP family membrane protein [Chachezhania sediminis]|uniref:YgaP family membrane protein n=1 Tax=Chachezhania sediminis TaxID=2599291 RepID=UPI00131BFF7B|nr:DUF2892 domain-containing protein [Chachezhania sediminis]
MFRKNLGNVDRIIRAILGAALLVVFFTATGWLHWVALVVGLVLLGTSALGYCPPYAILGINTCRR